MYTLEDSQPKPKNSVSKCHVLCDSTDTLTKGFFLWTIIRIFLFWGKWSSSCSHDWEVCGLFLAVVYISYYALSNKGRKWSLTSQGIGLPFLWRWQRKNISKHSRCPIQDSNRAPPEYETRLCWIQFIYVPKIQVPVDAIGYEPNREQIITVFLEQLISNARC
jgi:hypothetical protein